jgi:glycogen operon protein
MLLGGDEFLRTQRGNNNAYCQDNDLSWFDWSQVDRHADFVAFVRQAIALVRRYPVLHQRKFLLGTDLDADGIRDITWFGADGGRLAWDDPDLRTLCCVLDAGWQHPEGDEVLCFVLNADWRLQAVRLPPPPPGRAWHRVVDTSLAHPDDFMPPGGEVRLDPQHEYLVNPRSTVVLLAR